MVQVFMCGVIICVLLGIFWIWGGWVQKILNISLEGLAEQIIFGFLAYFIFFQIIALPVVLLKQSLTLLTWMWYGMVLITFLGMLVKRKIFAVYFCNDVKALLKVLKMKIGIVVIAAVCLAAAFAALQAYNGWDVGMYIGGINKSLSTDTFYFYNGNVGSRQANLNLRYALSMFYVHFTVLCRVFHIEARIMMFYCVRVLCVILAAMVVYIWAKKLFSNQTEKAAWMVFIWLIFNWFMNGEYTTASFLFLRGYEAKGFCANVVLPLLLYGIYCLVQENVQENWKKLFLIAYASVPISMSSLAIVPVAIGIMGVLLLIREKHFSPIIRTCFLCVLPNLCYLFIYMLYDKGYILIGV